MATSAVHTNPNANLSLSNEARGRMRNQREGVVPRYYNDGRGNRGHCSYGIGILVYRGPCTAAELALPVTSAQIEVSFTNAIREAERGVRRNVTHQALTQAQFDALVSYSFNTGARGARETFRQVNRGDLRAAANSIMSNTYSTQHGRRVFMPGLVPRRREESAPFLEEQ